MIYKPLPKRFTPFNQKMPMEKCQLDIKGIKTKAIKLPFKHNESEKQICQQLPDYFTMDHQKMPMQKYQLNQLNSNSKSLKIPFISVQLPNNSLNSKTETFKQKLLPKNKYKKQNASDSLQKQKRSLLISKLQAKQSNQTQITLIQQNKLYKYKFKQPEEQFQAKRRIATQGNIDKMNDNQQLGSFSRKRPTRQKYYLPLLSLNKIKQRIKRKAYDWRKQYSLEQTAIKQQKLLRCYNSRDHSEISKRQSRKSQMSTNRKSKIKTKKQIQNQILLQKILTIKPSHQLSREKLTNSYAKHQQYRKLKQSNISRHDSMNISRSRTLSVKNDRYGKMSRQPSVNDDY